MQSTTEYKDRILHHILNQAEFIRASFKGKQRNAVLEWDRVTLRPIELKGQQAVQFAFYNARHCVTKNYSGQSLAEQVELLLNMPFRNIHSLSTASEIRMRVSLGGKVLVSRQNLTSQQPPLDLSHDRRKQLPLTEGIHTPFLEAIGIMTSTGRVRADKQKKFSQVNEFLKVLAKSSPPEKDPSVVVDIVDCGCGSAALTFGAYHFMKHTLGRSVRMTGLDVRAELTKKHQQVAFNLGWTGLQFCTTRIENYEPEQPPDIVLALHACDTATDEALARAVAWQSKVIICVPCCHHNLQAQLYSATDAPEAVRPIMRDGLLRERLGDLLTDAFRAQLLRLMGYETSVFEFISDEHTAKNVMIRAVKSRAVGASDTVREYLRMKEYWSVTPCLEQMLGERVQTLVT